MKRVGVGTRALNFVVDTLIICLIAYAAFRTWNWYVMYWSYPFFNFWLVVAVVVIVYYTIFESISGRTPGKWLSYSKVVNQKGKKPGFLTILIRSMVRVTLIDMFFIPFIDKTLHDHLSKTEVVEI